MQQLQESSQELSAIFNLTIESFKTLQREGLDLNHLFVLECLSEGTDLSKHMGSIKVQAWKQNLRRKGFLTVDDQITTTGKGILSALYHQKSVSGIVKSIKEEVTSDFEKWWSAYPSTDRFEHKGVTFYGSRGLRRNKEQCHLEFSSIINEGKYIVDDLIQFLLYEVVMKKEKSVKEGKNMMTYMQNSLTYLNQRTFENFVELAKNQQNSIQGPHTMDI